VENERVEDTSLAATARLCSGILLPIFSRWFANGRFTQKLVEAVCRIVISCCLFFILFGVCGNTGTALVPHTVEIDPARLQQGLSLAQEAAQLAQFQHMKWPCHGHGWQPTGSKSFQSWFLLGACICKRISLTRRSQLCNRRDRYNPKKPQFYSLWVKQTPARKVQRGDQNFAGLKLKPNDQRVF